MIARPELSRSIIAFYDVKKRIIVKYGSSRPCGCNARRVSIHAEQLAINYCKEYNLKNRIKIYIWRYDRFGKIKTAMCCRACTQLIQKYNYESKIFTFDENLKSISAISDNPQISLAYKIIHNL